jgi:hypothetical protein
MPDDGFLHIVRNRIDREARNIIGESTRNFSSIEVLNDPKVLEAKFKKDLQESLDKEYGKDTFKIVDAKVSNILVAESIETRLQSIALIDAETAKNNAIVAILKNRESRMTAEAKAIKNAADASGLTVDQLLQSQMIDTIKETGIHPQVTVSASPKMK